MEEDKKELQRHRVNKRGKETKETTIQIPASSP